MGFLLACVSDGMNAIGQVIGQFRQKPNLLCSKRIGFFGIQGEGAQNLLIYRKRQRNNGSISVPGCFSLQRGKQGITKNIADDG